MEIIEYEPINLYDGRFCKVFHSDWIQLEKPKDVNSAPHFHWHNSFEFNCSISGTLRCEIGSTMTYAKDNDFLFVNPNVIHKSLEVSASFLGFAVLVPVSIIQLFFNPDSKNYPIIEQDVVNRHRKEIIELLMDIYRYSRSEKPVDLLGMNACVLQIFHILLSESMAAPTCTTPPRSKLEDSISFTEYLAAHYREHITLESVSEHFGFNPTYFSRIFAKKTGRNFNVYLSSLRLDHATHLLETTTSSIPDISEESGFSSSSAFIEMFKKVNELTPKQYRDQCNEHKKVHHSND